MRLRLPPGVGGPQGKYGAKKTQVDGFNFDSMAEADFYIYLKMIPEVLHIDVHPFATLGPGDRHCIDFLVIYRDGRAEFIDVKGASKTEAGRQARKLMKRWTHPIPLIYRCRDKRSKGFKPWE